MRDLFFLTSGELVAPGVMLRPLGGLASARPVRMSNTIAVLVRDGGDVLLVDAGWSAAACAEPIREIGRVQAAILGMKVRPADATVAQLRALGIEPARVRWIVATHLHLDHVGGVCDFPNAEVICTDVELSAHRVFGRIGGYRADDLARAGRLRPIAVDGTPTYGFPASHDLFGDGEVVLLDAHGHTSGSIAVALRSRGPGARCYVHVGDAVYQSWEYALSPSGPSLIARATAWRRDLQRERYASLRACEADPRRPVIVPSHDADVFARLPHAPHVVARNSGSALAS